MWTIGPPKWPSFVYTRGVEYENLVGKSMIHAGEWLRILFKNLRHFNRIVAKYLINVRGGSLWNGLFTVIYNYYIIYKHCAIEFGMTFHYFEKLHLVRSLLLFAFDYEIDKCGQGLEGGKNANVQVADSY